MRVITETKCCQAETLTEERKFEFFLNSFIFNIEYYLKQIKKHGSRSETRSLPIFSIVKVSKLFPVLIPIIMTILDKFILYTANISNVISFYRWNAAESKQINPAVRITTNRLCLRPVTPPCVLTGPGNVHYTDHEGMREHGDYNHNDTGTSGAA